MLETTTNFSSNWCEVRMLWIEPKPDLSNNSWSVLGLDYSLEQRFETDPNDFYVNGIFGENP